MIVFYGTNYENILFSIKNIPQTCFISGHFTPFPISAKEYLSHNNKTRVNALKLLKLININEDVKLPSLSYFELQKLRLISAIINNSSLIVFEEPSLFLSDKEKTEMANILNLFNLQNIIIFEKNINFCKKIKGNIRYLPIYPKTPLQIN